MILLLSPGLANSGWVESLEVGTGAIYATEPRSGITLEEELLRIARHTTPGRLAWRVVYDFDVDGDTSAPTAFPIDLQLRRSDGPPGRAHKTLEAFLGRLEAPDEWLRRNDAWTHADEEDQRTEQIQRVDPAYRPEPGLWEALRTHDPLRARVPVDDLQELGVAGFEAALDGRAIALSDAALGELTAEDDGSLRLRLNIPMTLQLRAGQNLVELRWTTPGRASTTHAQQGWSTRYDLRPAKSWGSIGRFTLALDRELTRGASDWALPWQGPLPVGQFVLWSASNWTPDMVLELDGRAPYLFTLPQRTAWDRRIGATWTPGGVPTLAWATPTATSTDPGADLRFYDWDGWISTDIGFAPLNAVDGAPGTAWCAEDAYATLTLDLPRPAVGLRIQGGRRGRHLDIADQPASACPDAGVLDTETVTHAGCIVEVAQDTRVPNLVVVRTADTSYPLPLSTEGDGLLMGRLPAGPISIDVEHPDGACLGEVTPGFEVPSLLAPDLRAPQMRSQAGL